MRIGAMLGFLAIAVALVASPHGGAAQETPSDAENLEAVAADGGVRSIAAGYGHTCAVSGRGNVWCWGANQFGQLGIGTTTASLVPQRVTLGTRIRSVTAGSSFTCALSTRGRAYCWGNNYHGELGDTTRVTRTTPVEVSGLGEGVRALVAGLGHTCAINADFELLCWGNNEGWPLGRNDVSDSDRPLPVLGLPGRVTAVAGGTGHSCAIARQGRLYCWGTNSWGQLGTGEPQGSYLARRVTAMRDNVLAVAAGGNSTCAISANNRLRCWGINVHGQLGNGGSPSGYERRPVPVADGRRWESVAMGVDSHSDHNGFTCAVTIGGLPFCWGYNTSGQLGNGTQTEAFRPVAVSGIGSNVREMAPAHNGEHSCAITGAGIAYCWGGNSYGQLGINSQVGALTPQRVHGRLHSR